MPSDNLVVNNTVVNYAVVNYTYSVMVKTADYAVNARSPEGKILSSIPQVNNEPSMLDKIMCDITSGINALMGWLSDIFA